MTRSIPSVVVGFVLAIAGMVQASAAVQQQAGAPGTGTLAGVVISSATPAVPLRNAVVEIQWGRDNTLAVRTDFDGRFEFRGLPAGDYRVSGSKVAYVPTEFGREVGARQGVRITLKAGEQLDGVTLVLRLGAVITGRVINEFGSPVSGSPVVLMRYLSVGGERRLFAVPGPWATTDQTGGYRIVGIDSGEYVMAAYPPGEYRFIAPGQMPAPDAPTREVTAADLAWAEAQRTADRRGVVPGSVRPSVAPPAGRRISRVPVFYPDVLNPADAAFVSLAAGEARSAVDFTMRPAATAQIQGCVVGQDGQPAPDATLSIGGATVGLSGCQFTIDNLQPGRHTLVARSKDRLLTASLDIDLTGSDVSDVQLVLQPAASVSGRIILPGSPGQPVGDLSQVTVTLFRIQPVVTLSAVTDTNGGFTLPAVGPGRYYVRTALGTSDLALGSGWMVDRVETNGRQAANAAIDVSPGEQLNVTIALADGRTELSGVVQSADRSAVGYHVVVFPTDPESRILGSLRFPLPVKTSTAGTFHLAGLPLGSYHVVALSSVTDADLLDSEFLKNLDGRSSVVVFTKDTRKHAVMLRVR